MSMSHQRLCSRTRTRKVAKRGGEGENSHHLQRAELTVTTATTARPEEKTVKTVKKGFRGTPCLHGKGREIRDNGEKEKDLDVREGLGTGWESVKRDLSLLCSLASS
ncbi:hypothetical protein MHYP_G00184640 [Metynnis hypsauchen]